MLSKLMIGTLTTLNAMMSPLARHGGPYSSMQTFDIPGKCPRAAIEVTCPRPELRGGWTMTVQRIGKSYINARLRERPCKCDGPVEVNEISFNIPTQTVDIDLIEKLPLGHGYVVYGVPLTEQVEKRVPIKISRLPAEGSLIPITVEWIVEGEAKQEPVKIWIASDDSESTFPWRRISMVEPDPQKGTKVEVRGELSASQN